MGLLDALMARAYDRAMVGYERAAGPRRDGLLAGIGGPGRTVVELGPGTGVNLPRYPAGTCWLGVEPSRPMRARLRAKHPGRAVAFVDHDHGVVGLPDACADAVVCTLVLCSVPDPARTLAEARRLLRPGGRFVFLEHVAAAPGTWTRRLQRAGTPLWRRLAGGCRLDRDTARLVAQAGFASLELEAFGMPRGAAPGWVRPHVQGVARR